MPLDEESKEFVRETVKGEVGPLKENLEIVDKVQQAVETIKEKLAAPPAPPVTEPKDTALDEDRLVANATQRIREEQEEERQRPGAGHSSINESTLRHCDFSSSNFRVWTHKERMSKKPLKCSILLSRPAQLDASWIVLGHPMSKS